MKNYLVTLALEEGTLLLELANQTDAHLYKVIIAPEDSKIKIGDLVTKTPIPLDRRCELLNKGIDPYHSMTIYVNDYTYYLVYEEQYRVCSLEDYEEEIENE